MGTLDAAVDDQSPDWAAKLVAVLTAILTLLTPVAGGLAAGAGGVERCCGTSSDWRWRP